MKSEDLPCREFVERCAAARRELLDAYLQRPPAAYVGKQIAELVEAGADATLLVQVIEETLTDAFITMLYGLSGASSLGDYQQRYALIDEDGRAVFEDAGGDLQSYAYELIASKG